MELRFSVTEEQAALRDTARRFLRDKSPSEKVREDMASDAGFDESLWKETAQMGWQAMAIPEEHGGAGYGTAEVAILFEEMGRALFCAPFLSSSVLATGAVTAAGSEEQRERLLPGLASGELRLTVAAPLRPGSPTPTVRFTNGTLSGDASPVIDGHTAHQIVVYAQHDGGTGFYLVDGDAGGVRREPLEPLDQTRKLARLTFDGAAAERLGSQDASDALARVVQAAAVALANEQVGGTQQVLDMAVGYAQDRKQFGRAIGSFQAIKHRCAELLVELESAKSAAYHAARVLAEGDDDESAIAVPLARSYCSEVFERAAADNIQIHGGIGFTWEHDAHLYLKRAKSAKLLLGDPGAWRRELADTLGF